MQKVKNPNVFNEKHIIKNINFLLNYITGTLNMCKFQLLEHDLHNFLFLE